LQVIKNAVAVVVGTKHHKKMNAQWKALFSMQVDVPRHVRRETLFGISTGAEKPLDTVDEQFLWEYIEKNQLGHVQAQMLITEYEKEQVALGNFDRWHASVLRGKKVDSVVFHHFQSYPGGMSVAAGSTDAAKTAAMCLARAVRQIPALCGFDTVNGLEESGKERQQGHIAEVRWGDIGGLDR
jgi:hypothetical protein